MSRGKKQKKWQRRVNNDEGRLRGQNGTDLNKNKDGVLMKGLY